MRPNRLVLRKVTLCILLITSLIIIAIMSVKTSADEISTYEPKNNGYESPSTTSSIEAELREETDAFETREDKIALLVNYIELSGVSTSLENGEVYAPIRFFAEAMLDCKVRYTESEKMLTVESDGLYIKVISGKSYIVANGRYLYLGEEITLREDGQFWLPCSTLAMIFGCEYTFDQSTKTANLIPSGEFIENASSYYNSREVYWLSRIISAESRGEPLLGKLAVGTVVMNRVDSSRFPNSIYDVIFDGRQFSPAVSGSIYKTPTDESVIAAKIVLEGFRISEHILFFHSANPDNYVGFVNTDKEMLIGRQYYYTYYGK